MPAVSCDAPRQLRSTRPLRTWSSCRAGRRAYTSGPLCGVAVLSLTVALTSGCHSEPAARESAPVPAATEWFVDGTKAAGLDFLHVNGMSGELVLAEIMGAGVALFDYDNDGDLDAYAVQGGTLAPHGSMRTNEPGDRLYRNELRPGNPTTLTFTDVTAESGVDVRSYGMGVAAGDIDNDGWVDLYLTRLGADVLLRNNGDGTFGDITRQAGISDTAWSVPASFFDFDRDGWLDLYV